jgi:hypothetical protein
MAGHNPLGLLISHMDAMEHPSFRALVSVQVFTVPCGILLQRCELGGRPGAGGCRPGVLASHERPG